MTIFRTSGKNIEIYEEYELYTKEYVENVGGKSNFKAKDTVVGEKPKTAPPLELNNIYVKVRLKNPDEYKGEFGFDWVDVHPDTKDIEKIQDVPFADVEYFYKEGATNADLGDIILASSDPTGAKNAIQKSYKFNNFCKYVDTPFVLIKPPTTPEKNDGQEIILSAEVILHDGEFKEDEITITGDDYYEFEIVGGTKDGKTAKIKVTKAGKIDFKIKCIKESNTEYFYDFKHSNPNQPALPIGGVVMMENKVLKLKFRVIALVTSDNNPNEKAKALFKKFKDAGVKDYLNKNSLNQAGYEVKIENYDQMNNENVDEYFYAFDKADWTTKKYFANIIKQKYDLIPGTNTCRIESWDSVKKECAKIPVPTDVIVDNQKDIGGIDINNATDDIIIKEYKNKLRTKRITYDGGIIILNDFESSDENTGA